MKTLKQIIKESDYTDPKAPADKAFVDKHVVQKTDYPHTPKGGSNDEVFAGSKQGKKKKKRAGHGHEPGQDKEVYERTLTKGEQRRKETMVRSMKKNAADFISRYGKDAESVMHATATKQAKAEESTIWDLEASENEIDALKGLHETLNDANKEEFEQQIKTPEGLKKMIEFAIKLAGE
mgnify:CR=1 FL=1|tara:strand:- start:626 stop:1162 length:537 start_codon:yes stop_codon:yes gene_type:complete